ncbi:uncharacterized protein A4U43_C08F18160 [Asparagus officinalis]|nr:uncharacterized protein A4U43_C08F18160 [Asparagus officinalis]
MRAEWSPVSVGVPLRGGRTSFRLVAKGWLGWRREGRESAVMGEAAAEAGCGRGRWVEVGGGAQVGTRRTRRSLVVVGWGSSGGGEVGETGGGGDVLGCGDVAGRLGKVGRA